MHWPVHIAIIFFTLYHINLWAQDVAVFDVRQPVPLNDSEKVYRDYYVNGGTEKGIRPGVVITVKRSVSLYDAYQNKSPGDLSVPVGRLRIIHTQRGLSVGRMEKLFKRDNLPVIDHDYIMIGDRLDLSTMGSPKKRKNSSIEKDLPPKIEPKPAPAPVLHGPPESADFASKLPDQESVNLPSPQ